LAADQILSFSTDMRRVVTTTVGRNVAVTNKRRAGLSATAELLVELLAIKNKLCQREQ